MTRGSSSRPWVAFIDVGVVVAIAAIAYYVIARGPAVDPNAPHRLTNDVAISGQLMPGAVKALRDAGFRTIVNMRPDGEVPGQPNYGEMQSAVQGAGLAYGYAPQKLNAVSPVSIEALGSTLTRLPKPALLYSEPASRAAQAWALAEASKPGGLDAAAIESAIDHAGAGPMSPDLSVQIRSRVSARKAAK